MCGKACLSVKPNPTAARLCLMHTISRDTPALYLTAVAKDRLPVFRTDSLKVVTCKALDEARTSGGFALYAYVIMPDHLHALTDSALKPSKVLQYINGIISRRVIDHLKERGHNSSLRKLRRESGSRGHQYSLWEHHSNAFPIFSEDMFMQKRDYIHQNPVRAGLAERAEDYRWSSVRIWKRCSLDAEPLLVDSGGIRWRKYRP
jgi:REP-associated tyrosine transposase